MTGVRIPSMHVEPDGGIRLRTAWDELVSSKIASTQSAGAFTAVELVAAPRWRRSMYVHHEVDECFYVAEGSFWVELEDRQAPVRLVRGAFLYVARGLARSLWNAGGHGRLVILQTPGHPPDTSGPHSGIERVALDPAHSASEDPPRAWPDGPHQIRTKSTRHEGES